MTRIIAGRAGSLSLKVPPRGTRPTSDRVREAIFSTLEAWDFICDTRVLDLYAGSGALGLEALSRGAAHAVLVEKHPAAARVAYGNAQAVSKALGGASFEVVTASVQTWLLQHQQLPAAERFDVALLDPPYDLAEAELAENLRALVPLLQPAAAVLVERDRRSPEPEWPDEFKPLQRRTYGETVCWWAELAVDDTVADDMLASADESADVAD